MRVGSGKNLNKSFFYTERAARHGDRDAQFNLANWFYEPGVIVEKNMEEALCGIKEPPCRDRATPWNTAMPAE